MHDRIRHAGMSMMSDSYRFLALLTVGQGTKYLRSIRYIFFDLLLAVPE